jgi:hypothetical protein
MTPEPDYEISNCGWLWRFQINTDLKATSLLEGGSKRRRILQKALNG